MNYDLLIFDMDGVVIDSNVLFHRADDEFFKRRGIAFNQQELLALLSGVHITDGMKMLVDKFKLQGNIEDLQNERMELLRQEYQNNLEYVKGFEDFFKRAQATGIKTCIATSSVDELLELARHRLKLDEKFNGTIFKASDVGNVSKPNPAVFLHAAKQMGVELNRCLVIEDAPKGVQAANTASMYSIGITTGLPKEALFEANMVINSYSEFDLKKLL